MVFHKQQACIPRICRLPTTSVMTSETAVPNHFIHCTVIQSYTKVDLIKTLNTKETFGGAQIVHKPLGILVHFFVCCGGVRSWGGPQQPPSHNRHVTIQVPQWT